MTIKEWAAWHNTPPAEKPFYKPQYGTGVGNVAGAFMGLSCLICEQWQESRHARNCPVGRQT